MKKETRSYIKEVAYYSSLGFQISFAIFIGAFLGEYLDKKFNKEPIFTIIGLIVGIIAGYRNISRAINRIRRSETLQDNDEKKEN